MKNPSIFLFSLLFSVSLWSSSPVPYSGKVAVLGVNFSGNAEFAFSLFDEKGNTHWRNGGNNQSTLKVPVNNGRYSVLLGGQGMNILPAELFLNHDKLYLKVRFDNGDGKGLRHLEPDQQITTTPRALVADIAKTAQVADTAKLADSVKIGGVTASQIKNNTITTAQLNEQILKYLKPEITRQPNAITVFSDSNVSFSVAAEGKYLTYQWKKNGMNLAGETNSTLIITDTNASLHDGNYTAVVTNDFGNISTQTFQITVNQPSLSVDLNSTVSLDMLWVDPGTFKMGSPTTETGRGTNETEHNVTLTKGFYLGKYEVTQAQYEAVMTGNSNNLSSTPSQWPNNPNRPVEKVSWADIQIFLSRLNTLQSKNIPAGWAYVLPTESEWEYACRAGTTTVYSWGININASHANYEVSGLSQTSDVGQYSANSWGFFDMHGNVWEWTADWLEDSYPSGSAINPTGPSSGTNRIIRGGSWYNIASYLRSAARFGNVTSHRDSDRGFRIGLKRSQ